MQHLHGQEAVEPVVADTADLAHAAGADLAYVFEALGVVLRHFGLRPIGLSSGPEGGMAEDNPFAPSGVTRAEPGLLAPSRAVDLDAARVALAAHTRNPDARTTDRAARGPAVRYGGPIAAGLGLLAVVVGVGLAASGGDAFVVLGIVSAMFGFVVALLGAIFVVVDLRLTDRGAPHDAVAAATTYWRTVTLRPGVAWSALSPTARGASVPAPALPPLPTGPGVFTLRDWRVFRDWTRTFAVNGHGQTRSCQWRSTRVVREQGDAAETVTTVRISALPQWAMAVTVVAFVLVRILGLILFGVFHFTVRKSVDVAVEQRWLRGDDGAWYLLDAAVVPA